MTPWVTSRINTRCAPWVWLQFGHGGDAVGDLAAVSKSASAAWLQFGHGGDAVGDAGAETGRVGER